MKNLKLALLTLFLLPLMAAAQDALPVYVITGSGTSFTATKEGTSFSTSNSQLQSVITIIKYDAGNAAFEIKFGEGANALDIGSNSILFNGSDWNVTLSGKITSAASTTAITLLNGANVESKADITNSSGIAIGNNGAGTLTISEGIIQSAADKVVQNYSAGILNISGGTISATTGTAVYNNSSGIVNISGGIVEATTSTGRAVYGYPSGKITVSGTALVTSPNANATNNGTIFISSTGTQGNLGLEITGGTVENTSTGNAVFNATSTNPVIISGGTVSAISGDAVRCNAGSGLVTISGGTVEATTGRAVYNNGGTITVNGGTVSTESGTAIYNSSGPINISGGIISAGSSGSAIHNGYFPGGYDNSFSLGGNPTITGKIIPQNLSVVTDGENAFAPGENIYTFDFSSYSTGTTVVRNGKNFLRNFAVANTSYGLGVSGNNLVLRGIIDGYTFAKSGTTYTITKLVSPQAYTLQETISSIKTEANGAAVGIKFGDGVEELDIGTDYIIFDGSANGWDVTLSGKITSSNTTYGTIYLSDGASVKSEADITNSSGRAIYNSSTGTLTISGGTISATGSSGYAVYNNSTGTVNINGGTISATGYAVYSNAGSVVLGGSPAITDSIRAQNLSVLTAGADAFVPGGKIYTLSLANYVLGSAAVTNGRDFIENFALANSYYGLAVNNSDLVIAYMGKGYEFEKIGSTYIITEKATLSQYSSVQAVINTIKIATNGAPCEIQFGSGTDTLDIGVYSIIFNGPEWDVTLKGKITSYTALIEIEIKNGANVKSEAIINNIHIRNSGTLTILGGTISSTITNDRGTTLNIIGGTISTTNSTAINNYGILNISDGTISAATYAIKNNSDYIYTGGTLTINGGNISATDVGYSYAIYNNNTEPLTINGGNISAIGSSNYSGYAVYNDSTGIITINGGTISAIGSRAHAVYNKYSVTLAINGGNISATDSSGYAVYNYTGSTILGGSPTITGSIRAMNLSVLTEGIEAFAPGEKIYTLNYPCYNACTEENGSVAVENGKDFIENFIDLYYDLAVSGNDIALNGKFVDGYIFAKSGTTYAITKKARSTLAVATIQAAINAIKTDANGAAVEIQFGSGTDTLDIGSSYITFDDPDWDVTLSGTIASSNLDYIIFLNNGASINSKADIIISSPDATPTAIYNNSHGTVNISGGTISAGADVVNNAYVGGYLVLGGNPTIMSTIHFASGLSVITEGLNAFAPGEKIYTLNVSTTSGYISDGTVAVRNGKNFLKNFVLTNNHDDYALVVNGNDLVLKRKVEGYILAKSGTTYTITRTVEPSGLAFTAIKAAIDSIKTDANGAPIEIQFGNGTDTLDIGSEYISFNGSDWDITLSGKIKSADSITIFLSNYASIKSKATIINTYYSNGIAINIPNSGIINIIGGTISATGDNSYAVRNYSDSATLGGSPAITGIIVSRNLSVVTEGENAFVPGENIYTVDGSYGSIAVINGKDFSENFVTADTSLILIAEGNDLVFAIVEQANCIAEGKIWENDQCTTPIRAPQIAASQIRAQSIPNGIMLQNLPQNAKIEAYNLQGRQVYSSTSHSLLTTSLNIPVSAKGIYIVKISLGSQKQILRVPVR